MPRYLLLAAAVVAAVALSSPAHAHGPGHFSTYRGGPSSSFSTGYRYSSSYGSRFSPGYSPSYRYSSGSRYVYSQGTRFSHGYYFGRHNFYWNRRCWSRRYGCYCYWNPYVSSWYYWYGPGSCYYPISYIGNALPTTIAPPPGAGIGDPDAVLLPDGPPLP